MSCVGGLSANLKLHGAVSIRPAPLLAQKVHEADYFTIDPWLLQFGRALTGAESLWASVAHAQVTLPLQFGRALTGAESVFIILNGLWHLALSSIRPRPYR